MIIINFAHPITPGQQQQIEEMVGEAITAVYHPPVQLDNNQPFLPQLADIISQIPLTAVEWQTEPLLVNPPGLAPAASALIAELHGRIGYFPAIIRIRPINGSTPPRFEVAEIINLQELREKARQRR